MKLLKQIKKAAENYDEYNAAAGLLDTYQKALIEKRDMISYVEVQYIYGINKRE